MEGKNYNTAHVHISMKPWRNDNCVLVENMKQGSRVENTPINYKRHINFVGKNTIGIWKIKGKKYV